MAKWRKGSIYLVIACVLISPLIFLGCFKNEQKAATAADQFLFAIVNDTGPKKERFQVLTYVTIDENKELFAIVIPEDTRLEMPGVGYVRVKHAYYFKDLSLTSRSIAKFIGASATQEHFIAIDVKYIATMVDDMGGIHIRRSGRTLDGKTTVKTLYWATKKGDPETHHAIVSAILEKLVNADEFPDNIVAFEGGVTREDSGTNLNSEEFKKTITSLRRLEKATVVLLPGSVHKNNGISYWAPKEAVLDDFRRMVAKDGLVSGIKYVAQQKPRSNSLRRTVAKNVVVAGIKYSAEDTPGASRSATQTAETTITAIVQAREETKARAYTVDVFNGGRIAGSAARISQRLRNRGFTIGKVGNTLSPQYKRSVVFYLPGWEQEAKKVAGALGISTVKPLGGVAGIRPRGQVVVVVGRDIFRRR